MKVGGNMADGFIHSCVDCIHINLNPRELPCVGCQCMVSFKRVIHLKSECEPNCKWVGE